MDRKKWE